MLPAVTAELPAYLVPPRTQTAGRATGGTSDFGPSANVELSAEDVRAKQSRKPGVGLYGPNGRFVEPTSQKQDEIQPRTQPKPESNEQEASARAARVKAESDEARRQLSLAQVDAALPPAQRDELKDLARRIQRRNAQEPLPAKEYKQIANLMQRVGEFKEARQALEKARKIEQGDTRTESAGGTAA